MSHSSSVLTTPCVYLLSSWVVETFLWHQNKKEILLNKLSPTDREATCGCGRGLNKSRSTDSAQLTHLQTGGRLGIPQKCSGTILTFPLVHPGKNIAPFPVKAKINVSISSTAWQRQVFRLFGSNYVFRCSILVPGVLSAVRDQVWWTMVYFTPYLEFSSRYFNMWNCFAILKKKKKILKLQQMKVLNDLRAEKMLAPDSVEGTCGIVFGLSFGRRWTKSPAMLDLPNDPISLPPYLSCSPINTPPLKWNIRCGLTWALAELPWHQLRASARKSWQPLLWLWALISLVSVARWPLESKTGSSAEQRYDGIDVWSNFYFSTFKRWTSQDKPSCVLSALN